MPDSITRTCPHCSTENLIRDTTIGDCSSCHKRLRPHVQLTVLCGHERQHWWCPHLGQVLVAAVATRAADYVINLIPAFDHRTSQEARNEATGIMLAEDQDWLILSDNDTNPINREGVQLDPFALVDAGIKYDLPIVAAPIPIVQGTGWSVNVYEHHPDPEAIGGRYRALTPADIVEWESNPEVPRPADAVGTGTIAIRRDVLARMEEYWCHLGVDHSDEDVALPYSPAQRIKCSAWQRPRRSSGETEIGEDLYFSEVAAKLGFPSHVLPALLMGHLHTLDLADVPFIAAAHHETPTKADFRLDSLHGLEPSPYSITPWIAQRLREAVLQAPREYNGLYVHEFGSGISSLVLAASGKDVLVASEEPEELYHTQAVAARRSASYDDGQFKWTLLKDPEDPMNPDHHWPSHRSWNRHIGLVFVDGPKMDSADSHERHGTVPRLLPYLLDGALVVVDDAQRPGVQASIEHWENEVAEYSLGQLHCLHTYGPRTHPNDRELAVLRFTSTLKSSG